MAEEAKLATIDRQSEPDGKSHPYQAAIEQLLKITLDVVTELESAHKNRDTGWEESHDAFADDELFRPEYEGEVPGISEIRPAQAHVLEVYSFVARGIASVTCRRDENPASDRESHLIAFESRLFWILRWHLVRYLRRVHATIPEKRGYAFESLGEIERLRNQSMNAGES